MKLSYIEIEEAELLIFKKITGWDLRCKN